jgi:group II intron reverse transcriptase/maturase
MVMNGHGKSDNSVLPKKLPNKGGGAPSSTEGVEGRELAKGNLVQQNRDHTQRWDTLQHALERIRQAAKKDRKLRFTALWHHVYRVESLRKAFLSLKRESAAGVDGVTWRQYAEGLEERLTDLSARLQRGAYRARPVKRVYIPKRDGRQRPIGVTVLEDKVVQKATVEVLNAVYETDFLGFSYGSRPGRNAHNALDALSVGMRRRKVNWVLDADIRGYFDAIDHEWLVKFVEHRIADKRVARHIKKWLNAGVLEDGKRTYQETGTPQGGSISPLLANIYLHYVFDLWIQQWRKREARGEVIVVRYVDDIVVGFQYRDDAERFLEELGERFHKFNLELHPEKTRLIEFGRYAATNRRRRGEGKPETFNFLGMTHICGKTKKGRFQVIRQTMVQRMCAKLKELKIELRRRMHFPVSEVGRWLKSVLRGHYQYYGVPGNKYALNQFRHQVARLWYRVLLRRSQRKRLNWERMKRLSKRWLPYPRIVHPYPERRLRVTT